MILSKFLVQSMQKPIYIATCYQSQTSDGSFRTFTIQYIKKNHYTHQKLGSLDIDMDSDIDTDREHNICEKIKTQRTSI